MKIILNGDEVLLALERYRAFHDPDNTVSVTEIISNPETNQLFIEPLLHCIVSLLFIGHLVDSEAMTLWMECNSIVDAFRDHIVSIEVLSESCDILLILK